MNAPTAESKGPIFVVGSPRSGTSVLTWCIGQHPNILAQEESGWIGPLVVDLAVRYQMGSTHGERSQLSALGLTRDQFMETFGHAIDTMVLGQRETQAVLAKASAECNPAQVDEAFQLARSNTDSKSRWVDGTPEYSTQIYALKKLFPTAKFVHIVRDVESVVDSMLHFRLNGQVGLVDSEQAAYEYWLRTASTCVQAEAALGGNSILRVRYDDLIHDSERALRRILAFLDEPFDAACLQPLSSRINSSNVPPVPRVTNPSTPAHLIEAARHLSAQLQAAGPVQESSINCMKALEAAFEHRVDYVANMDNEYHLEIRKVSTLTTRLDRVGFMLAGSFLMALVNLLVSLDTGLDYGDMSWFTISTAGFGCYLVMRWKGLCARFRRWRISVPPPSLEGLSKSLGPGHQ